MMINEAQHQLSAARRWSERPDVRSSGILSQLDPTEIKRQEVCGEQRLVPPRPVCVVRPSFALLLRLLSLSLFLKAIAEVMHTEEAYAIDLSALNELLLQPMHVCLTNCGEAPLLPLPEFARLFFLFVITPSLLSSAGCIQQGGAKGQERGLFSTFCGPYQTRV